MFGLVCDVLTCFPCYRDGARRVIYVIPIYIFNFTIRTLEIAYKIGNGRILTLNTTPLLIYQLRESIKDKGFKTEWNSKFSWFTQKRCETITTIHGEKQSDSVSILVMYL
jgi:hypothetical protein